MACTSVKGLSTSVAIEGLHNEFGIAAEKCHSTSFDFLGRTLEQQPDYSIRVSQRNYLDEVQIAVHPKAAPG